MRPPFLSPFPPVHPPRTSYLHPNTVCAFFFPLAKASTIPGRPCPCNKPTGACNQPVPRAATSGLFFGTFIRARVILVTGDPPTVWQNIKQKICMSSGSLTQRSSVVFLRGGVSAAYFSRSRARSPPTPLLGSEDVDGSEIVPIVA